MPGMVSGLLLALHALAAVIWVGGMFFAYVIARPSLAAVPAERRPHFWVAAFGRFFPWVIAAIAALLVSGYGLVFGTLGGFAGAGVHVHIMQLLGWVMFLLFLHLYFAPWRRFRRAVGEGNGEAAAKELASIRRIVATNLGLGLAVILIATAGRYW